MPIEIVRPGTEIDFIGKRKLAGAISAALILAAFAATLVQGPKLGIDFAGGTEMQLRFDPSQPTSEGAIRDALGPIEGVENASVVRFGSAADNEFLIKFRKAEGAPEVEAAAEPGAVAGSDVVDRIREVLGRAIGKAELQRVDFVGPRVGSELRTDGLLSLFYASVAILIYIAFRFSSRFAPGAIVAVLHDLIITAGIFVILGMEFDLRILAAMLAILGYSLNDTIIIYDRIRENMELRTSADLVTVLNQSVNQTLSRTVLTSGTTLMALLALFFLGGEVIRPFAFAMLIGVVVGTYSSVYIAAPTLMLLEQRAAAAK